MTDVTRDYDASQHRTKLTEILPDEWPRMRQGSLRCVAWVSCIYDCGDAVTAEINARDLKAHIERGALRWRGWMIDWEPGQRESVLKKIPSDVSKSFEEV